MTLPPGTKPGDHPDFFRLPAPAGRSRESTIRLDREGRFWHDGEPVEHEGVAAALAGWIDRHPDDGRFILTNGYDWTYFTVEDVPFLIRSLSVEGADARIALSDGTSERLDASSVVVGERDALYCRVKGGRFEARFTQSAQTALAPLLRDGEHGEVVLEVRGRRFRVGSRRRP